ncbi:ABC transporter permease [Bartonella tamiae]|uniref:ABC transmembrane type-1 domain-containing protein n=1 Tax=Bartonella tamiae Th239 TaxID=1094558 RepID=J0ZPF5_9HYPH|nr:ABC transporter permease subunit [Bartonella tamiae]EJF90453.1 hypothetical protein ME5_00854 [Bartonella tamiae Th239]EJF93603.1 hypothetical protein MEG_01027 [Bartonella tamiae Th307]
MSIKTRSCLYALPFIMFLAVIIALPLWSVLIGSLGHHSDRFAFYTRIINSKFYLNAFISTIQLSLISTLIGITFALPISISLRASSRLSRHIATALSNLGANFAGVPAVTSFIILLGVNGVLTKGLIKVGLLQEINIYSFTGLILTYSFFQISLGIILIIPIIQSIPKDIEEAAVLMGTTKYRFWTKIGLPIVSRQIIAVFILLFANAMGAYATAFTLIGTSARIVTVRISELVAGDVFANPGLANALAVCLLIILLLCVGISQLIKGKETTL